MNVIWVKDQATFIEVFAHLCELDWVALDTEFERRTTFYPHAGLIQISDGSTVWLVDPLCIDDWEPLAQLLRSTSIVMHAASEDLEVMRKLCGEFPKRLFDTQTGAMLVGLRPGLGFADFVESFTNEVLAKDETRSDWLARPLTEAQIGYAVDDVKWLSIVFPKLLARLGERVDWVWQEGEYVVENTRRAAQPEAFFERISRAGEYDVEIQGRVKALSDWREHTARAKDIPRNRLMKEAALVELAKLNPSHVSQMTHIDDLPPGQIRRFGDEWIRIMSTAEPISDELRVERPLTRGEQKQYKQLMAIFGRLAETIELPREAIVSKKIAQPLIRGDWDSVSSIPKWRQPFYNDARLEFLENVKEV